MSGPLRKVRFPKSVGNDTVALDSLDVDHYLTEYGTTDCPVEGVRAHVDDGECSACGSLVDGAEGSDT